MDDNIGHLREYLRNKLRVNKLVTDARDGARVNAFNAKAKPEPIPEHNDPYRVDWTEVDGRPFVVGTAPSSCWTTSHSFSKKACGPSSTSGQRTTRTTRSCSSCPTLGTGCTSSR
jgi:hypothetical protein